MNELDRKINDHFQGVVVRKDLATQRLLTQAVLGKGVRSTDPGVREALDEALANVKEQVGLD